MSIPPAIVWRLKMLSANIYRQLILRNRLVVRLFPLRKPPILLLSYPRSGSSWVGDILAASTEIAYLFEPVTSPYQKYHHGPALADLSDPVVYQSYRQYSQDAFGGIPTMDRYPGEILRGFSLIGRRHRRLLVKEVNPRAAGFYCERYRPLVLFLIRHPAAVALSFWNMGWLAGSDVQLEAASLKGDAWEKFGYAYGTTIKSALEIIEKLAVPHKTLFYEQLASDPLAEFAKVFEYMRVAIPENYEHIIDEYCFSGTVTQGYPTRLVSKKMIAKWKNKLTPDAIASIRRGYFRSRLDFYQSDADWEVDFAAF